MIAPESRLRRAPAGAASTAGIASTVTLDVPAERPEPAPPERAAAGAASTTGTYLYGFVEGGADAVSHLLKPFFGRRSDRLSRRKPFVLVGYGISGGVRPILAVGERQEESDRTADILRRQLDEGFRGIERLPAEVVIAYEPVWAIGTGLAATPDDAQARCALIRSMLAERFDAAAADACRIQYGGSVNAQNIEGYAQQPDIDGALVGGASLDAAAYAAICRAVAVRRW